MNEPLSEEQKIILAAHIEKMWETLKYYAFIGAHYRAQHIVSAINLEFAALEESREVKS